MEHRCVGGVELIGAKRAADRDDVDRQVAHEQGADLHRRSMGTQQLAGAFRRDIEGVLFAAGRVVGWKVQRVEIELLGLDLRSLDQFPAHRDEGVGDVFAQEGDRVARAGWLPGRRQGHVDALGHQSRRVALGAQRGQPLVVAVLGVGAGGVDAPTGVGALGFGQRGQRLASQCQG